MDEPERNLDDPEYAAFAWGRFKRILRWMTLVALLVTAVAELSLYWSMGELHIVTATATFLGVFFTIMLTAVLMGLMFLSSGTHHDERIEDPVRDEIDLD